MVALLLFFAVAAGAMLPMQAGINAQLGKYLSQPVLASLTSTLVSSLTLLIVALVLRLPVTILGKLGHVQWWFLLGGVLGAAYVFSTVVLAPRLGATLFVASVIVGQLITSVLADQFGWVGYMQHSISPGRLVGIALLIAGVLIIQRF